MKAHPARPLRQFGGVGGRHLAPVAWLEAAHHMDPQVLRAIQTGKRPRQATDEGGESLVLSSGHVLLGHEGDVQRGLALAIPGPRRPGLEIERIDHHTEDLGDRQRPRRARTRIVAAHRLGDDQFAQTRRGQQLRELGIAGRLVKSESAAGIKRRHERHPVLEQPRQIGDRVVEEVDVHQRAAGQQRGREPLHPGRELGVQLGIGRVGLVETAVGGRDRQPREMAQQRVVFGDAKPGEQIGEKIIDHPPRARVAATPRCRQPCHVRVPPGH